MYFSSNVHQYRSTFQKKIFVYRKLYLFQNFVAFLSYLYVWPLAQDSSTGIVTRRQDFETPIGFYLSANKWKNLGGCCKYKNLQRLSYM